MKLGSILIIAVGLLVLYVASRGGMDCVSGMFSCLAGTASGAGGGGGFSIPTLPTPGGGGAGGGAG